MLSIKQANVVIYTNQKKSNKKTNTHIHTTGQQENINDIYRISSTLRFTRYPERETEGHTTVENGGATE